jgi:hypothetical protein
MRAHLILLDLIVLIMFIHYVHSYSLHILVVNVVAFIVSCIPVSHPYVFCYID